MHHQIRKRYTVLLIILLFLAAGIFAGCQAFPHRQASTPPQPFMEPGKLFLSDALVSMTQSETLEVSFELPEDVPAQDITWLYGGKPLSEWKKQLESGEEGSSFITVGDLSVSGTLVHTTIHFDLPYDTENLAQGWLQGMPYMQMTGMHELAAVAQDRVIASAMVELRPYDSFCTYEELKERIDAITLRAMENRFIQTESIGKSAAGRDIYMTILAKDEECVKRYEDTILPAMLENPAQLQQAILDGSLKDYQIPVFISNVHPNEFAALSGVLNFFEAAATQEEIAYRVPTESGGFEEMNLNMGDVLENVFFLIVYTENPDGMANLTRDNADYFDLNRDGAYQAQPESQSVARQIAKWCPITFLELHGYDSGFLIEPCTPPHNPNVEIDLLMENMLEQAHVMGQAAIANTKYDSYYIPYEEYKKMLDDPSDQSHITENIWDDASSNYTATFAMQHGAMGHTIEIPEMNQNSVDAAVLCVTASTNYVSSEKERLFLNQLEIYRRGVENVDSAAVDTYLVNAAGDVVGRPRENGENFFPEYYVWPVNAHLQKNPLEVYHVLAYFLRNGVKVEQSICDVTVGSTVFQSGSYVIDMHQAKRGLANLVLYDGVDLSDWAYITAPVVQDFPTLRGFDCYVVRDVGVFAEKTENVSSIAIPSTQVPENCTYVVIQNTNNDVIRAVNLLLSQGKSVAMLEQSSDVYSAGDFVVASEDIEPLTQTYFLDLLPVVGDVPVGKPLRYVTVNALGEAASALKTLGFSVSDTSGDVLVNTFDSLELIRSGTPYIAYGNMGMYNVSSMELLPNFSFDGPLWEEHEGVFLANLSQDSAITSPYNNQEYLYSKMASWITSVPEDAEILITMSEDEHFYKAGWWPMHDSAKGNTLAFRYLGDDLNITVFAIDLINSAHSQNQYRLLANAIFTSIK